MKKSIKRLLCGAGLASAIMVGSAMTVLAVNPYLPFDEYMPDCEPRVFGDRVYIYGSHDIADYYGGGCAGSYEAYSASVDDLDNWTYEGVLYDKTKDPGYQPGMNLLASDCVEKDGKYYLYYSPVMNTDGGKVAVAKSDTPQGPFEYYGKVAYEDGTAYDVTFDPAVLVDDDGKNYLFTGGESSVVELADDMLTIIGESQRVVPRADEDPNTVGCITNPEDMKGAAFYEGSSIRKIGDMYYLIWANEAISQYSYATSDAPKGPYTFRGILISNDGKMDADDEATYPYGNIHGGLAQIKDQWYLFYHRQTNGVESRFWSARQGCVEKVEINEDGSIDRVEMTSQGISGKPIDVIGTHSTFMACYLKPEGEAQTSNAGVGPYTKQFATNLHGISNITNHSVAGFKYFDFGETEQQLTFTAKVRAKLYNGTLSIYLDAPNAEEGTKIGEAAITGDPNADFVDTTTVTENVSGVHAVYFVFEITDDDVRPTDSLCDITTFSFALPEEE